MYRNENVTLSFSLVPSGHPIEPDQYIVPYTSSKPGILIIKVAKGGLRKSTESLSLTSRYLPRNQKRVTQSYKIIK